jgi:hypothetical protein
MFYCEEEPSTSKDGEGKERKEIEEKIEKEKFQRKS